MAILLLFTLFACLKTARRLRILLPFMLLIPNYLWYITQYRTFFSEQIVAIVAETNPEEAWGYIGYIPIWTIVAVLIWLSFMAWLFKKLGNCSWSWQHRSRYWTMLSAFAYLSIAYSITALEEKQNQEIINQAENLSYEAQIKQTTDFLFLSTNQNTISAQVQPTYPLGLAISLYRWYDEWQTINQFVEQMADYRFGASSHSPAEKETIVLVIGESARRKNWQIHGYTRETNPLLSKQENLIALNQMQSLSDRTRESVPMMLTRKPASQVHLFTFAEKSLISAFKEAGFRTYWLSNQQKYGMFDNSISVYAKEADVQTYINISGYQHDNNHDGRLLPKFTQILTEPYPKKFIVLHTLGSHADYAHRYPADEAVFLPDLRHIKQYSVRDAQYQQELLNAYDNTIIYTDKVLNSLIEQLKQQNHAAFLLFSSDHGEDLLADGCGLSGHGNLSQMNYEAASFIWYSDTYQAIFSDKISHLQENQHKTMSHSVIFTTLLDAAAISLSNSNISGSLLQNFTAQTPRTYNTGCKAATRTP